MTLSHLCPEGEDRIFWEKAFIAFASSRSASVSSVALLADEALNQWCERFVEGYEDE